MNFRTLLLKRSSLLSIYLWWSYFQSSKLFFFIVYRLAQDKKILKKKTQKTQQLVISDFENGIFPEPQRKQWLFLLILTFCMCRLHLLGCIWICVMPSLGTSFTYSETRSVLSFLRFSFKKILNFFAFAIQERENHKLRAVKKIVPVKSTGNKHMLQFKGDNSKGSYSGRSNNSWNGTRLGKKISLSTAGTDSVCLPGKQSLVQDLIPWMLLDVVSRDSFSR